MKATDTEKTRDIVIKLQSVRIATYDVIDSFEDSRNHKTVGAAVDDMIQQARMNGQLPNKLVIDLCPKQEPRLEDME